MGKHICLIPFLLLTIFVVPAISQEKAIIKGIITDENETTVAGANIIDLTHKTGTVSNSAGSFELSVPVNTDIIIEISFLGYKKVTDTIRLLPGQVVTLNQQLEPIKELLDEIIIESRFEKASSLERINLKVIDRLPTPSGGVESILLTLGATSRNEMSSQYSVRGGNYDENLIYVNDIEIYRPLLIRSGQQEGMSFINSAMVSSIQFSAGGFEAQYGDKMSSVLDIKYKRPNQFGGSIMASLLGASVHVEGASRNQKFTHISGVRYKTNQYLLNSLQTKGDYKPKFFDFQTFMTYNLAKNLEISFLGNIARNDFNVIPKERNTEFGTYQQALKFTIYYEGQELDRFNTYLGALTFTYNPVKNLTLKIIGSAFNSNEKVSYDILGQYWINQLDNTIGSESAGDSILNIGVGSNLQHARNYLDAYVYSISHKGSFYVNDINLKWGFTWQRERIFDQIREWEMLDSAGYSVPNSDEIIELYRFVSGKNRLLSNRYSGFVQSTYNYNSSLGEWFLTGGIRFHHWEINDQLLISPRAMISLHPYWKRTVAFHGAIGLYYQPPFYKELLDQYGKLYKNLPAQESIHYLIGGSYTFNAWSRPFKFTTEIYYKYLAHLIPYKTEDVNIQYLPQYHSKGYTMGIEFKLNGEFVKDAESWATMSIMETREDVYNDYYIKSDGTVVYPGYYPRPTNQMVNFGLFFQDYFPNNPDYKVHLSIFYGSRLPFGAPDFDKPSENYEMKAYKRIDIGLSKSLLGKRIKPLTGVFSHLHDAWINLEIFNLFGFENQASYQWVRSVSNQEGLPNVFAVPIMLTGRLLNIRLMAHF
jgi:hypothetical protein